MSETLTRRGKLAKAGMEGQMLVSVVICTHNRQKDIIVCLDSMVEQTHRPNEVIIVDASDEEGLEAALRERNYGGMFEVRYLRAKPDLTRQRNIGVKASSGDIIFLLDDDVVLEPSYLENVMQVYAADAEGVVGGVQGRLSNSRMDPSWKRKLLIRLFLLCGAGEGKMLSSGFHRWVDSADPRYHNLVEPLSIEVMNGCIQSYRRKVFDDFQFNERLRGYATGEDRDFSYRVSRKYRLCYTPLASAEHRSDPLGRYGLGRYYRQLAQAHVITFLNTSADNPLNWLAFCWSILGHAIYLAIFLRSSEAVQGLLRGYVQGILREMMCIGRALDEGIAN